MFENKQSKPKLNPSQEKCLIINSAVMLDAIVTSYVSMNDDLVLRPLEEGVFSVLKDGKRIVEHLDKLTTEHGYDIVLYSNRREHQIIHARDELDKACKREGLNGFPKITTMIVKDREAYKNVRANDPKVAEDRSHGIQIAGYSLQSQQETEILNGCFKFLHFSKLDQKSYIVIDNRPSFIEETKEEGWNTCDTTSISLKNILKDLCQKSAAANNQNIQKNLKQHTKEEKNAEAETNIFSTENDSASSPSKALDDGLQSSIYLKHEAEQKNLVKMSSDAIVKPTANNLGPSLDSLKTSDGDSQKLSQMNTTMEVDKIEKEELDIEEFEEFKDWSPNDLLPSHLKFKIVEGAEPLGTTAILRWFVDETTNSKWVGKCSSLEIYKKDHFFEYKEFLGGLIYKLLGIRIPTTVFSEQILAKEIQQNNFFGAPDIDKPRLCIVSSVVPGFELLGDKFIEDYKASSKRNKKQLFHINKGNLPLRGFGKVVAVSILIHDSDFVGNSGRNIGCIPSENGEYLEILKIDPGESLSFAEDHSMAKDLDNPPSKRGALAGTGGKRIEFGDLNELDKRECVETLKKILEVKVSTLEKIFLPFFNIDDRFKLIFEELLNRRKELLAAFCGEVGNLIERYIRELEEQKAAEQMSKWGKPPLYLPQHRKTKDHLIRNKAQLGAFTAATNTNSTETKILQAFSYKEVNFIGRESELSQIKMLFSDKVGITGCAIVGGPGLGKSQLATEYISRNQKEMYSDVIWLHAEQSDLIVDQIQIYLETCYKIKFGNHDKDKKTTIIRSFYQTLIKEDVDRNKGLKKPCIVFDTADSMAGIAEYLPDNKLYPKLKIDIIVTSRYKKWDEPLGKVIEMQAFDVEETKNYITACIPHFGVGQDGDKLLKDTEKLNDLTGGLPLALSLAIAYIQQKGISVSEFCDFITQENNKEFISLQSRNTSEREKVSEEDGDESKSPNFVSTIFTLALADIRSKNYNAEPILDVLAYLSPDNISIALLIDCWMQCNQKNDIYDSMIERIKRFTPENSSNRFIQELWKELLDTYNANEEGNQVFEVESFNMALDLLLSYSLITANPIQNLPKDSETASVKGMKTNNIRIHQLTQQVIRLNHQKSGVYERIYEKVFNWVVKELRYEEKELEDVRRAAFLVPHAINLEGLRSSINNHELAKLQELIGGHQQYGVGNYNVALKYYQKAYDIKTNYYGKDHPETGITLSNLGSAWGSLGDYKKTKDFLTRALSIQEKHYGKNHPQTAIPLNSLGVAWGYLGDYKKKKDLLTQALVIQEKHNGKNHHQTGNTLSNLGNAWGSLGDYEKQKNFLTRALVIQEKHYGKDHPEIGKTLGNLSNAWGSLGDYEKKKDLLTRALVINEKHYGKDHPETGITLSNLGNAWGYLGDYEKQKDLLTRALVIKEKHYGKNHPQTGNTLNNLSNVWGYLGDYEKQKDLLTRALVIFEKHYGKDHPETGKTLGNLGNVWGDLGDYEKQKDLLTQALVIIEKHYGKDHPQTGITLTNLGVAWGSLGGYEKAKDLLTRALVINEKHFGKDHPQTGLTLTNLGNIWGDLGDYEKHKDLLTQALSIFERNYPPNHPYINKTKTSLNILRQTRNLKGQYSKSSDIKRSRFQSPSYNNFTHQSTNILSWQRLANYYSQTTYLSKKLQTKLRKSNPLNKKLIILQVIAGNSHCLSKNYSKQSKFLEQVYAFCQKRYPKNQPINILIRLALATSCSLLKNYERQKILLSQALIIAQQEYGAKHLLTGIILANLGAACLKPNESKESFHLQREAYEIFKKHFQETHKISKYSIHLLKSKSEEK